jgi:hypothetical protein
VVNVSIGRYGKWKRRAARDRCVWTQRCLTGTGLGRIERVVPAGYPDRSFRADNEAASPIRSVRPFAFFFFNMTARREAAVLNV